jgi:Holliday junction resolvase-like predicted endonuclease
MSQIIGYGEDALTYWAITSKLDEILRTLGDNSYPSATTIIYRPGFGRRGSIGTHIDKEQLSAEFGEFDAILGTQQAVYLVESKWDSSSKTRNYWITLKGVQSRRHEIMRWYLKTWRMSQPKDWTTFVAQQETTFQTLFPGNKLAPADSRLAQNLEFVLKTLGKCGAHVQDVLLFIGQTSSLKPIGVKPDSFKLVILKYQPLKPSGYFQIQYL